MDDLKPTDNLSEDVPQPTPPRVAPTTQPTTEPTVPPSPPSQTAVTTEEPGSNAPSGTETRKPKRTKIIISSIVLLIILAVTPIAVFLVQREGRIETRAGAFMSPDQDFCGLHIRSISDNYDSATGTYTATYSIKADSSEPVTISGFWYLCRCPQGGYDFEHVACSQYYPQDVTGRSFCLVEDTDYVVPGGNQPLIIEKSISQYQNVDCGAFQIDYNIVTVNGQPCSTGCHFNDPPMVYQDRYCENARFFWGAWLTEKDIELCISTTPTPTPTPPLTCLDLTSEPAVVDLEQGDTLQLTCRGSSGSNNPIDHVEFRFLIDDQQVGDVESASVTEANGEYQGVVNYTVSQTANYRIECRVCTSADDSQCTEWGKSE